MADSAAAVLPVGAGYGNSSHVSTRRDKNACCAERKQFIQSLRRATGLASKKSSHVSSISEIRGSGLQRADMSSLEAVEHLSSPPHENWSVPRLSTHANASLKREINFSRPARQTLCRLGVRGPWSSSPLIIPFCEASRVSQVTPNRRRQPNSRHRVWYNSNNKPWEGRRESPKCQNGGRIR